MRGAAVLVGARVPSAIRMPGPAALGVPRGLQPGVPRVTAAPLAHGEAEAQGGGDRPPGAQRLPSS